MATTADIRNGIILKLDNSLYSVIEFGQNKTARSAAKVWAKLKGVDNTRSIEHTWNSGENIYPVRVEKRPYQFLYKDDSGFNLMDTESYEQISLAEHMIDNPGLYKDGQECFVMVNTETETPSYLLMDFGVGANWVDRKKNTMASIHLAITNLGDVAWQSHTSRLKYTAENPVNGQMGVFNRGRNISLRLLVPFIWKQKN